MPNIIKKPIQTLISTKREVATQQAFNGSGLTFTLCDRLNVSSKEANYFISFNLPSEYDSFKSGSTISLSNPELLQLNVNKIIISPIPPQYYNEMIDGRTMTINVPTNIGGTAITTTTLVSSTYSTLVKSQSSPLLGENIAFLFSDSINLPYTGTTLGGTRSNSGNTTWNTANFINRPYATKYSDLSNIDINSDKRTLVAPASFSVPVTSSFPNNTNQGYNYDIPAGFISLDKGFIVLTHPSLVDNIPWTQGQKLISNQTNSGATSATTNIYFSGTSNSMASFTEVSTEFKTSVVCLALPGEFYFSNNPTWDKDKNFQEQQNGTNQYDSTYVTEVGLYNKNDELIAIAKLSEPVEKNYVNLINFTLDIDV